MASRIPAAWRIGAGKSTIANGGLNFSHIINKTTSARARCVSGSRAGSALISTSSTASSPTTSPRSTTTSTPAITTASTTVPTAWPPRLRLGSSGTNRLARSLFQRQQLHQQQQRRSFGGCNFLIFHHSSIPSPRCIYEQSSNFSSIGIPTSSFCCSNVLHGRETVLGREKDSSLALCWLRPSWPKRPTATLCYVSLETPDYHGLAWQGVWMRNVNINPQRLALH